MRMFRGATKSAAAVVCVVAFVAVAAGAGMDGGGSAAQTTCWDIVLTDTWACCEGEDGTTCEYVLVGCEREFTARKPGTQWYTTAAGPVVISTCAMCPAQTVGGECVPVGNNCDWTTAVMVSVTGDIPCAL